MKQLCRMEIVINADGVYTISAAASRSSLDAEYAFGYFYKSEGIAFSGERLEKVKGGIKDDGELLRVEALDDLLACLVTQTRAYNLRLVADSVKREPEFDDGLKIDANDAKRMTNEGLSETYVTLKRECNNRKLFPYTIDPLNDVAVISKPKSLFETINDWYDEHSGHIDTNARRSVMSLMEQARFVEKV